jgi:V-type H+-transporting ATPase subunit C
LSQIANRSASPSGNLATKSLTPVVNPALLIRDSEYLETHLIVVPTNARKDFLRSYETLSPMVVPRSSVQVAQDDEFTLFAVTTFKKHGADFVHKCREQKWTPRQYKYVEGGQEEEQRELDRVAKEEKKVWGEALRMGRTGWSETVMIWLHVLTLRVFVEAVLRYGLPLEYVTALVMVSCSPQSCVKHHLLNDCRQRQNLPRRLRRRSTLTFRISGATHLGETSAAGSPRTTPR